VACPRPVGRVATADHELLVSARRQFRDPADRGQPIQTGS
jgi:hypothetical protein